uniref:Nonstructural protein 1 n=1 Tax=Cygnus atratus Chaphamaparvovirus TaxID=2794485 RepID=A0A8A4XCR0_9VIRU|nr:MAG: nonstructural protein 1 [Cygnus atratus Chaphamaparvovirus]
MERTRPGHGINLWVGSTGTSRDLNSYEAETFLIPKPDWDASDEAERDRQLNLLDMKQFQCMIMQINDANGEPFTNPLIYCMLLNDLATTNFWVCTGELNQHDIFHVHAMLQTPARTDSVRRSLYTCMSNLNLANGFKELFGQQVTFECLKLERCHKPQSMLTYLMKQPQWVCANRSNILQLTYDIWYYDLAERFRPKENEPPLEMNTMTKELVECIIEGGAKSLEDLMRTHPSNIAKYLHRPGLGTIISNCLSYVRATGNTWDLSNFQKFDPYPGAIHRILLHQGIEPTIFDQAFHAWIRKTDTKRNTICLIGPSNTGKSATIAGLKQCIAWGECVNSNTFPFEGLIDSTIGVWEEPLISPEVAEKAKQIFEGMVCSIPVKFKKPHKLPRTPIIITTNHVPWRFCTAEEQMFKNRMWIFNWMHQVKDVAYTCRAVEHSCECGHCTGSRGGAAPTSITESREMQTGEQSILTREESIRTSEELNVGGGSMCDPGEGTSWGYNRSRSCSSSSASEQRANSARSTISTSSTIEQFLGFRNDRPSSTGKRIYSAESGPPKQLESDDTVRSTRHDSGRNGSPGTREQFECRGGNGTDPRSDGSIPKLVGMGASSTHKSKVSISAKKRKMDRTLDAVNPYNIPLFIPSKQDWQEYMSYLYHWYG